MRDDSHPKGSESIGGILYCISNGMRRKILNSLVNRQSTSFSELMEQCGLSPKYDTTGTFTYHLSELGKIGAIEKDESGYRLTRMGNRIHEIVHLLERESRFLKESKVKGGEKVMAGNGVVIRKATGEDKPAVADLVATYYYEMASRHYEVPKDYYEHTKNETDFTLGITGRNIVFLAQEEGEDIGVCWWMVIEKENVEGGVYKEAFLEHLYVKSGHDYEGIAERMMKASIPILLQDEKVTFLNVWYNEDEPLSKEFYVKFDIKKPENLEMLMHVAQWARPTWEPKTIQGQRWRRTQ